MRRKSLPSQTADQSEEEKLIEELAGLTDISMKREALGLCRRFLRLELVSPEGFSQVARVIGMFGTKARWALRLEAVLVRQPPRVRPVLQGTMLYFYAGFGDWKNALRFASTRDDLLPHEIAFAIEAFARAGRTREVLLLGLRIKRWVEEIEDEPHQFDGHYHELQFLLYGLGIFKTQACYVEDRRFCKAEREDAILDWSAIYVDHPLGPASWYNATDLALCMMLETVDRRIRIIEETGKWKADDTALSLPGNQEKLNAEMLTRFNRCRRALERLVPEKRRKELGMDRPSWDI